MVKIMRIHYKRYLCLTLTMKSITLSVLMTAMILVGISAPLFAEAESINTTRSNIKNPSNVIEQGACTNEQENEAENEDGGDQLAVVAGGDQSNDCIVVQNATATNTGAIVDDSDNDITAVLADLELDDVIALGSP
jgi:hypothetical protein